MYLENVFSKIPLKMYLDHFENVCWKHTKRQVYKNAQAHNIYHRCLSFIFDQT